MAALSPEEQTAVRAYMVEAVIAAQDTKTIVAEVIARWGPDVVPVLEELDRKVTAALPRADRRRLKRKGRKSRQ